MSETAAEGDPATSTARIGVIGPTVPPRAALRSARGGYRCHAWQPAVDPDRFVGTPGQWRPWRTSTGTCGFRKLWPEISGNSGRCRGWCLRGLGEVKFEVARAVGRPAQFDVASVLEDPVEDRFGEVSVVEDAAPGGERLVRREDHRAPMQVAVVHDLEEHVRGVRAVAEVANLVDDEDVGVRARGW
jgi:hypothetical protein